MKTLIWLIQNFFLYLLFGEYKKINGKTRKAPDITLLGERNFIKKSFWELYLISLLFLIWSKIIEYSNFENPLITISIMVAYGIGVDISYQISAICLREITY